MQLFCPYCRHSIALQQVAPGKEFACSSCGSTLSYDPGATAPTGTPPAASATPERQDLGKFRLLAILGQGAFGTVYKAHDSELDRVVALKVPRAGSLQSAHEADRFLREARSAAQLHHPAIVTLHEVGQVDGVPYLVSEFVPGVTLADHLRDHPPSAEQAATWAASLADALHYAHQKGIIHRDVKPSNIMLELPAQPSAPGQGGQVRLMDFGLARREAGEALLTMEGQILGTPAYMSPEQARGEGHRVDGRSDVYSLGVVLYQMLTGELPYRGNTRMILHQVLNDEPRPPRALNDRIPRDLETICLKAMAREGGRRYPSAAELADDLRRFLQGLPIRARPVGRLERAWRWCRRNPLVASLSLAFLLSLLAGAAVAGYLAYHRTIQATLAEERANLLEQEQKAKRRSDYKAQLSLALDSWERGEAGTVQKILQSLVPGPGEEDLRDEDWHSLWQRCHAQRFSLPGQTVAFVDGGRSLLVGHREEASLYDAATGQLRRRIASREGADLDALELSGNTPGLLIFHSTQGIDVLKGTPPQVQRLFQISTENLFGRPGSYDFPPCRVSRDGSRLAILVPGNEAANRPSRVRLWDLRTGKALPAFEVRPSRQMSLALSPDGETLAVGVSEFNLSRAAFPAATVELRDTATGKIRRTLKTPEGAISHMTFSPDGSQLAVALNEWDTQTGQYVAGTLLLHHLKDEKKDLQLSSEWAIRVLAYSADGATLAAGANRRGAIRLWNAIQGERRLDLWGCPDGVGSIAFSPDSKQLAAGGFDHVVRVWDLHALEKSRQAGGAPDRVRALAFTPDGSLLASGGHDHRIHLWDTRRGARVGTLEGHAGPITALVFGDEGRTLISGGEDRQLCFWNVAERRLRFALEERGPIQALALAPHRPWLAVGTLGDGVGLRDLGSHAAPEVGRIPRLRVSSLAFTPDGWSLAVSTDDNLIQLWDPSSGQARRGFRVSHPGVRSLAFSADGQYLASGGINPAFQLWETSTFRPVSVDQIRGYNQNRSIQGGGLALIPATGNFVSGINYVESGVLLALAPKVGMPRVWSWGDYLSAVRCVGASSQGELVAGGLQDGSLILAEAKTGKMLHQLPGHASEVTAIALSPDRTLLAEGRADFTVRLVDRSSGGVVHTLGDHAGRVTSVAFSRDGLQIVTGCHDRKVRLWETKTGKLLKALQPPARGPIVSVALSPDGTRLAAGDGIVDANGNKVWIWDLKGDGPPRSVEPLGWSVGGLAFTPDGSRLVAVTRSMWPNLHGNVTIWDPASRKRLAAAGDVAPSPALVNRSSSDPTWRITALALSEDGRRLATAGRDFRIRVWDLESMELLRTLSGHADGIQALTFSPDGKSLISSASDETLRYWDLSDGRERRRLRMPAARHLASVGEDLLAVDARLGALHCWQGREPALLQEYDQAARKSSFSSSQTPTELAQFRMRLAELHARQGDGEGALRVMRSARDVLPAEEGRAQRQFADRVYRLGQTLWTYRSRKEAVLAFQEAIRLNPEHGDARYWLAWSLRRTGRLTEALTHFQEAARLDPTNADLRTQWAFTLENLNRVDEALAQFREAARLRPEDATPHYEIGYTLGQRKRYEEAIAAFREAVRLRPSHFDAWNYIGLYLMELGKVDEAIVAYRQALASNTSRGYVPKNLANALMRKKEYDEAIVHYRTAIRLDPHDAFCHRKLGEALAEKDLEAEAAESFRESLRLYPNQGFVHALLGRCLQRQGYYEQAVGAFREAIRLDATVGSWHENLGYSLSRLGRSRESEAAYREAVRLDPKLPHANNNLGAALIETGRSREAIPYLEAAVRLRPGNPDFEQNLARAHFELEKYDEAIARCARVIHLEPRHAQAHLTWGECLNAKGRYNEAVPLLREALRLHPSNAKAHEALGLALDRTGRKEEARAAYREGAFRRPEHLALAYHLRQQYSWPPLREEGIRVFRDLIRLRPGSAPLHLNLGMLLENMGRATEAIRAYREGVHCDPGWSWAHVCLARVLLRQDQLDEGFEVSREAARLYPGQVGLTTLSDILCEKGRTQQALAFLDEILKSDPKLGEIHSARGQVLENLGRLDEAILAYREAARLLPDWDTIAGQLGLALARRGRHEEAQQILEKAIAQDPTSNYAYNLLAEAQEIEGAWDRVLATRRRAVRNMEAALAKDPQTGYRHSRLANTCSHLARLHASCPRREFRDPEQAILLVRKAMKHDPQYGFLWGMLSTALRSAELKSAQELVERSLAEKESDRVWEWLFLALAHGRLSDREKGLFWYSRAREWIENNPRGDPVLHRLKQQASMLLEGPLPPR